MRNPYVTGSYVIGHKHYGRHELQDYLLGSEGPAFWVIGNRRIGKTSLLRQLELTASSSPRFVPVFWDMQGCSTFQQLGQYLADALHIHGARLEALGVSPSILYLEDPLEILTILRRAVQRAGRELLLLCDETEVLLRIAQSEPEPLQRLHHLLTAGNGLRVVMTSTRAIFRMNDICQDWPTSPFLFGFDMSQSLGSLSPRSAQALVTQSQAPAGEQVEAAPEVIEAVCDSANNHPYLLQLLCSRLYEDEGRLRPIREEDLLPDPMLCSLLMYDFRSLSAADRQVVLAVHAAGMLEEAVLQEITGERPSEIRQRLHSLERLGYLRRVYGQIAIGNQFLANWLTQELPTLATAPAADTSEDALRKALTRQQAQEKRFLLARLNDKRDRLVQLEAVRAEQLLDVSPAVLDEIAQLQNEISHIRRLLANIESAVSFPSYS